MIEIPMQDGGCLDIADALQTNTDGAWSEAEAGGEIHERTQINSTRSYCDLGAKGGEIGFEAPSGGDHGEAGQRAFAAFALQNDRNPARTNRAGSGSGCCGGHEASDPPIKLRQAPRLPER
jgi:hypothetical protein